MRPAWHDGRTLPVLVTALLVSMGGPYSAYFGTFLLVVGGFIGFVRRPSLDRALDAAVCVGLVVGLFLLQVLPFVVGSHRQGRVQTTVTRTMDDYYVHALRLENLIRPTVGHRLPWLSQLSAFERDVSPSDLPSLLVQFGEARLCTPLGLLGSVGLFLLIAVALASPFPLSERQPVVRDLGKLTAASLLLCLFGGLGEVIAAHITVMIRCYNRISIYLSFFAYLALALMATGSAAGSAVGDWRRKPGFLFLVWGLAVLALLDQIPPERSRITSVTPRSSSATGSSCVGSSRPCRREAWFFSSPSCPSPREVRKSRWMTTATSAATYILARFAGATGR